MSGGKYHRKIHRYYFEKAWAYKLDLHVGKYPYAIDGEGVLQGELYWNVDTKMLLKLDDFEGHPNEYQRQLRYVSTNRMKNVKAWIYLYEEARNFPQLKDGNFRPFL